MAKNITNYFNVEGEDKEKWDNICSPGEYRVCDASVLRGIIPDPLLDKTQSVFVVCSGTASGNAYYMANINRVDYKDSAIDQMPFAFAFIGDEPAPSGVLLQHGDWMGRTTHPPEGFFDHITASGIGRYYPTIEMPSNQAGALEEIAGTSQQSGFQTVINFLQDQITGT